MMDNISFNSTMEESGFQNLFLSCGKQFVPSSLTVEEQIGKNTALISETQKMMDKHPEMSNSMSIALDSAMNHQKNLIIELGRQRGIHSEQDVLALEVKTESRELLSIPLESLIDISQSIGQLLQSIKTSFRKKNPGKRVDLTLRFAEPFAGSFGFFLIPQITFRGKKSHGFHSQVSLDYTIEEFILSPLRRLLAASSDEKSLRAVFTEMGASVARDYERYLKTVSSGNISLSIYSSKIAFPIDREFADQVLSRMNFICLEPVVESIPGRVKGIDIVNDKRKIIFVPQTGPKIAASFDDSLFPLIHDLFDHDVEALFDHRVVENTVSGGRTHEWHLKDLVPVPPDEGEEAEASLNK